MRARSKASYEPMKVENLARDLGMSVPGFHYHFKSVTAMNPLQYQKQVRLAEARRFGVHRHKRFHPRAWRTMSTNCRARSVTMCALPWRIALTSTRSVPTPSAAAPALMGFDDLHRFVGRRGSHHGYQTHFLYLLYYLCFIHAAISLRENLRLSLL